MDFSKLKHRVDLVPTKEFVIDHLVDLADHKEFSDVKNDTLVRICILSTSQTSPFVLNEREDYEKRIVKILEYLKISDKTLISGIINGTNKDFESMVTRYFMINDNLAYVMWSNKLRMFHYIGIALRQPIDIDNMVSDMDKRAKLDVQLQTIYTGLLDYESQIFPDLPTRTKLRQSVAKLLQPAEMFAVAKQVI